MPNGRTTRRPLALAAALSFLAAAAARAQPPSGPPGSTQAVGAPDSALPPLAASFAYAGELVTNTTGGARRGTVGLGVAGVQLTARLQRLVGWRGARAFVYVLGIHGGAPSDLVGDVQGVSNLQATPAVRLEEAWLEQSLFDDHASVLAGRMDLNAEFYRLQSSGLFVNSAFGIGPEFQQSGVVGASTYPRTTSGARVQVKPSAGSVLRLAAVTHGEGGGAPGIPASGGGALLVGEAVLLGRPDSSEASRERRFRVGRSFGSPYASKLAVGAWYYTARYADLADTLATGAPVRHRGSRGAYLLGDRTVWSAPGGGPGALTAFAQLGVGDARVQTIAGYASGGVTRRAPFPGRSSDELGVAVTAAFIGSHARRAAAAGTLGPAETTAEVTYAAQLAPWLALQPDVQLVVRPGGVRGVRSAFVPGLRLAVVR